MDSLPIKLSAPLLEKLPPDSSILTSASSTQIPHEVLEIREEGKDLLEDEGANRARTIHIIYNKYINMNII